MKLTNCTPEGRFADYIGAITEKQLLDTALWHKCADVFSTGIDNHDGGWRGEYWGKMMRGACLIYRVNRSEKLYETLTDAVERLLSKQDESGRISTYRADEEFFCWDMWARKYVMTGLQHYYDICRDNELKDRITAALIRHADYIVAHIGAGGKKDILETSNIWGGVNSASILEPFVRLYNDTKDEKYLRFAEYIVSTGGCRDGSLITAVKNGLAPYEFPENKAYETISFFEGILALYETTGNEDYLQTVRTFADAILATDYTVIGSCGCTHELFDHSSVMQTEPTGKIMQETCVTVTLMRFFARLYKTTGEKKLTDAIRLSALNALAGCLNLKGYRQFSNERKQWLDGLLFDSYSPLCDSKRALGIGGFKDFPDGTFFGCCACIASAGFALYPLMATDAKDDIITVNYLAEGRYVFSADDGTVTLTVGGGKIAIETDGPRVFTLRVTAGDKYHTVKAFSEKKCVPADDGYTVLFGEWKTGDEITLDTVFRMTETVLNGKTHLNYGGFALAVDTSKEKSYHAGKEIAFRHGADGSPVYRTASPVDDEQLRVIAETYDGEMILTDYASAGTDGTSTVSVWFA